MERHRPGGYFGRALVVDVTDASAETLPLPDEILRGYIGGAGLGAWLMHELAPPGSTRSAPRRRSPSASPRSSARR